MIIERTTEEVIIKVPSYITSEGIQRIIDLLVWHEANQKEKLNRKILIGL